MYQSTIDKRRKELKAKGLSNYFINQLIKEMVGNKEIIKKNRENIQSGFARTSFYRVWVNIKQRCLNKNSSAYSNYGSRGIKVCKGWLKFENFKKDMYESYLKHIKEFGKKQTTIDRINNDGNYELSNCKWSTRKEQANNKRKRKRKNLSTTTMS